MTTFKNARLIGRNVDSDAYHQTDIKRGHWDFPMSRSQLVRFAECPAKWIVGSSDKRTDAKDWGGLVDCLLLTPKLLEEKFIFRPDTYKNEKGNTKEWQGNATECKKWMAAAKLTGRTVITSDEHSNAIKACGNLNDKYQGLLSFCHNQTYILAEYHDDETGVVIPIKCLIDLEPIGLLGNYLGDLKTTRNGNPRLWKKEVDKHGYDVQAALSLDLYNAATGERRDSFFHIIVENTEPFHVVTPPPLLGQEFIQKGRDAYQSALRQYAACLKSGVWPSYQPAEVMYGFQIINPDAYMLKGQPVEWIDEPTDEKPVLTSETPS